MDYGVSYRGDEARAAEVAARAGQLVELTKAMMTSAGLSRLTKTYDLPTGEVVHVVIQDFSAHVYIDSAPTKGRKDGADAPEEQQKEKLHYKGLRLTYTAVTDYWKVYYSAYNYTTYPDWAKTKLITPMVQANIGPNKPLYPYYYKPDSKIGTRPADLAKASRFNVAAYTALPIPTGVLELNQPGSGFVEKDIDGKAPWFFGAEFPIIDDNSGDFQWTWWGLDDLDLIKFAGKDNRACAPIWKPTVPKALFDETNAKYVLKPAGTPYGSYTASNVRWVIGGGRIVTYYKDGVVLAGREDGATKVLHYVLASMDLGVSTNTIDIHVAKCLPADQQESWVAVGSVTTDLGVDMYLPDNHTNMQGAVFSDTGLSMRHIFVGENNVALGVSHGRYLDCVVHTSVELTPHVGGEDIYFTMESSVDVSELDQISESAVIDNNVSTNTYTYTKVQMTLIPDNRRYDPAGKAILSYRTWANAADAPGVDMPAMAIYVDNTQDVSAYKTLYNTAPFSFDFSIPTIARNSDGSYSTQVCTPNESNTAWVCPSGKTPYYGGVMWIDAATKQRGYSPALSFIATALGWASDLVSSKHSVPPSYQATNTMIKFTGTAVTSTQVQDEARISADAWVLNAPVLVDFKRGKGFLYATLSVDTSFTRHYHYRLESTESFTRQPTSNSSESKLERTTYTCNVTGASYYIDRYYVADEVGIHYEQAPPSTCPGTWQPSVTVLQTVPRTSPGDYINRTHKLVSIYHVPHTSANTDNWILQLNGVDIPFSVYEYWPVTGKSYEPLFTNYYGYPTDDHSSVPAGGIQLSDSGGLLTGEYMVERNVPWVGSLTANPAERSVTYTKLSWVDMRVGAHVCHSLYGKTTRGAFDVESFGFTSSIAGYTFTSTVCINGTSTVVQDQSNAVAEPNYNDTGDIYFNGFGTYSASLYDTTVAAFMTPTVYAVTVALPRVDTSTESQYIEVLLQSTSYKKVGAVDDVFVAYGGLVKPEMDVLVDKVTSAEVGIGHLERYG